MTVVLDGSSFVYLYICMQCRIELVFMVSLQLLVEREVRGFRQEVKVAGLSGWWGFGVASRCK